MSNGKPPGDYEVGYKKPPVHSRFKPGGCANPNGAPKKKPPSEDPIERAFGRMMTITEDGKKRKVPASEALIIKTMQEAFKNDVAARRDILRLMGRYEARQRQSKPQPQVPEPPRLPSLIYRRYGDDVKEQLGIITDDDQLETLQTWVVEAAFARMTPEQIAKVDFEEAARTVEDPSVLENYKPHAAQGWANSITSDPQG